MTTRDLQQYVTSGGATSLRTGDGGSAAQIGKKKNQHSKKKFAAIAVLKDRRLCYPNSYKKKAALLAK